MADPPDGEAMETFRIQDIYSFLKKAYRQRQTLLQTSAGRAEEEAKQVHRLLEKEKKVSDQDLKEAIQELKKTATLPTSTLPRGVDPEVEELVKALGSMKINLATIDKLQENASIRSLLSSPVNFTYFVARATKEGNRVERNDGSFISGVAPTLDPRRGTSTNAYGREYRNTCNMCNESGHQARECEQWLNLIKMGWVSFHFDRESKHKTYFYGPSHMKLGEIVGSYPNSFQLDWVKAKVRDYFEVTDDVLDQPASAVKPELFKGTDSRPSHRGNGRPSWNQAGQGTGTNTVTTTSNEEHYKDIIAELAEFQDRRILQPGSEDAFISLDKVDGDSIMLGAG